jgi:predicted ATPase
VTAESGNNALDHGIVLVIHVSLHFVMRLASRPRHLCCKTTSPAAISQVRFNGHGLYLLDEPEAALSPTRQMAFLVRLHDLLGDCSQFVIATHSPIVLAYPDSIIYEFDDDGIRKTEYEDTQAYQVTRRFMRDPRGMLQKLLGDE